jgi:hypothetical protein
MIDLVYILILQVISCAFMVGLIWVIQILHYPMFCYVAKEQFAKFHEFHSKRITIIVLPLMLFELATANLLSFHLPQSWPIMTNLLALILIWLSTFFISVPLHKSISTSMNLKVIERLVLTNWIRTLLWSLRLVLLTYFVLHYVKADDVSIFK